MLSSLLSKVTRKKKCLPSNDSGERLALTHVVSKSCVVQTLINTMRNTIQKVLRILQIGGMFGKEITVQGGFINIAICWVTCCLSFPSCGSFTIGPLCPFRKWHNVKDNVWISEEVEVWNMFLFLEEDYQPDETDWLPGEFPNLLFTNWFILEIEL